MSDAAKVITLQDIADVVGVHKSTVHRALRGDPRVEATTTARIREAATSLSYDPEANQGARRLSFRKTGRVEQTRLVAMLYPVVFTRGAYFQRMFVSFMETLGQARHDVLSGILDVRSLGRLPSPVLRGDVDAVVSLSHPDTLLALQAAIMAQPTGLQRPLVTLINPVPGAWTVTADLRQGGRLETEHLLELGHRRIITVGNCAFRSEERITGCREALTARGLDPDRHLTVLDAENTIADPDLRISEVLDRLLAAAPDATAFLAPQDDFASKAVALLAERGRPVPEGMSLVGFDDTNAVPGPDGQNRLTTVALPLEQLGREAARLAMAPGDTPRTVVLPVGLRVRGTTAPPRCRA